MTDLEPTSGAAHLNRSPRDNQTALVPLPSVTMFSGMLHGLQFRPAFCARATIEWSMEVDLIGGNVHACDCKDPVIGRTRKL